MSTPDLWTDSGHDWRRPIVLPTLPVAARGYARSVPTVMPDKDRRDRLSYAIRAAMGKRSAQDVAEAIQPKRSKETIARWARGETVPSALDVGPLARALGVKPDLLIDPPAMPVYPLSEYLVADALVAAFDEGAERARRPRAAEAPSELERSPQRRPRATGTERR